MEVIGSDQSLINRNELLYPTKYNKKTADWARSLGLQLPSGVPNSSSNRKVSQKDTPVNNSVREIGGNV